MSQSEPKSEREVETFFETSCKIKERLIDESAIALGFFDGVHPGHRAVIQKALDDARKLGVKAGIVTFKDHPRSLTRGKSPALLTVIEKRLELVEALGVDFALVLSFTEELCQLSPSEYVENVLVRATGARSISVGHNHHFGRDREGDADLLKRMGKDLGFTVNVASMIRVNDREVSSSRIREHVLNGQMQDAAELLQRPFSVRGEICHGDGRGRTIGFPTANLEIYEFHLLPRQGVYAGRARFGDDEIFDCVINVGMRPTFKEGGEESEARPVVEAHLFEIEAGADLYGRELDLQFLDYIREEKRFDSKEALVEQIKQDKAQAVAYLNGLKSDSRRILSKEERLHA